MSEQVDLAKIVIDSFGSHATAMIEVAARYAIKTLGYDPSQCLIESMMGACDWNGSSSDIWLLKVSGRPFFEVAVSLRDHSGELTVVTTPRVIEWPPVKP